MDGRRFDSWTRALAGGLPRRGALRALAGGALAGAAAKMAAPEAEAAGNFGDHCNKNTPCKSPLVCINTECDNCRTSGDCHQGWCCQGYTCNNSNQCVKCSGSNRALGVEGCRARKKKKKKKKH